MQQWMWWFCWISGSFHNSIFLSVSSAADVQPLSAFDEDDNPVPSSDPQVQANINEKKVNY